MSPPHPLLPPAPAPVPLGTRLRASFSQSGRTLGLVWRSSPGGTVALGALTVVAAALPPLVAWVGKLIIDAVLAAHAAATTVRTPRATVPPGEERHTSPSVRPDCEKLDRSRLPSGTAAGSSGINGCAVWVAAIRLEC